MRVDFFFAALPAVSVVLSDVWARTEQNVVGWGVDGGGSDSAEGFQFVLTTAGLVISGHVDLCVVIERGIKHTWRSLQTDIKAGFTHEEGEHKVLWSVTGSLQAKQNKRT